MPLSAAGSFKYVLTFLLPADIKGFKMVWHFLKLHQVNLVKPSVQNESEFFRTSESLFSIRNSVHWFRESIKKSAQILLRNSWKKEILPSLTGDVVVGGDFDDAIRKCLQFRKIQLLYFVHESVEKRKSKIRDKIKKEQ